MTPRTICPCRRKVLVKTRGAASWALPGVGLVLLPKCPICLAAWLAVGTGFSLPYTAAAHLRTALLWLFGSVLLILAIRLMVRLARRPHAPAAHR